MKCLKIVLLACLASFLLCLTTQAQPRERDAATRAQKLTEMMTSSLQLTPDQVPRVHEINLRYAQQVDEFKTSTMTKEEKKAKFQTMLDAKDAELKGVFTEEQYKSYQVKKKEFEKRMKERMKERNKAGVY